MPSPTRAIRLRRSAGAFVREDGSIGQPAQPDWTLAPTAPTPAPKSRTRTRVAMLVQNDVEYDTRVRKEAESLAANGYEVHVLGHAAAHLPEQETVGGVTYHRLRVRRTLLGPRWPVGRGLLPPRPPLASLAFLRAWRLARTEAYLRRRQALRLQLHLHGNETLSRAEFLARPLAAVLYVGNWTLHALTQPQRRGRRWMGLGRRRSTRWARRRATRVAAPVLVHTEWALTARPILEVLQPEVVHAHDLNTLLAARLHARRRPTVRLVYDAHELELHRNIDWTRWKRLVARAVEAAAIRRADAVITVSPLIAQELARTYRIQRPAVVLNSPSLRSRQLDPAFDLRQRAGLTEQDRLIVYVGGVLWRRGHEHLVEALALLPDNYHVGVLGPRKPVREAPLIELAEQLGVRHRLHLFGAVPAPQVPSTLRAGADATVIPIPNVCRSYDFALPNKLFDAVMAGVPVGVSRLTHMTHFVREHEVGLVFDETDPRSIAVAIDRLAAQVPAGVRAPERLASLQTQVSWEAQEQVLLGVYARLNSSRHP